MQFRSGKCALLALITAVWLVAGAMGVCYATNLLGDPSFEGGLTVTSSTTGANGWTVTYNGWTHRITTTGAEMMILYRENSYADAQYHEGGQAFRVRKAAKTANTGTEVSYQDICVVPGQTYTASTWVRARKTTAAGFGADARELLELSVTDLDAGGAPIGSTTRTASINTSNCARCSSADTRTAT